MKDRKIKFISDLTWAEREAVEFALLQFKHRCNMELKTLTHPENAWRRFADGREGLKRATKRNRQLIKATNQLLKKLPGRREYSAEERTTT